MTRLRTLLVAFCALACSAVAHTALAEPVGSQPAGEEGTTAQTVDAAEIEQLLETFKSMELPSWDYQELTAAADVVVIATFQESVERPEADYRDDSFSRDRAHGSNSVISIESKFTVTAVLKGEKVEDRLSVAHLKWRPNQIPWKHTELITFNEAIEVPWVIPYSFVGRPPMITTSTHLKKTFTPEYLLFLRRRHDGLYEMVSGQHNARAAVRIINLPYEELLTPPMEELLPETCK